MFIDKERHIHFYHDNSAGFFVNEFGHSRPLKEQKVGSWVRNTYLLHFVVKGGCKFLGEEVTKGHVFLLSQGQLHTFTVKCGYEHFWFSFAGEKVHSILEEFGIASENNAVFEVNDFDFVKGLCFTAFEKPDVSYAKTTLFAILSHLQSNGVGGLTESGNYASLAAKFIENNYFRTVTMGQLAESVNISEKHLCKLFVKQYGIPPQKYLLKVRMEKALSLLIETNLRIKEISGSVGYSSQLAFSEMFSKYYKKSPSATRIEARKQTEIPNS